MTVQPESWYMQQKNAQRSEGLRSVVTDFQQKSATEAGEAVSVDPGAVTGVSYEEAGVTFHGMEDLGYIAEPAERSRILQDACNAIMGDRDHQYGGPEDSFTDIAELWTVIFRPKLRDGVHFDPVDVARAMVQLKQARLIRTPDHRDSWVDTAGYAGCGAEVAGAA